jgi:flagellar secretion chaperone FliS
MSTALYRAANAYANVDLETSIESANPHRLILMLFEAALLSVAKAKNYMVAENIASKGFAISKAIQIIEEGLNASVDENAGGQLAVQLKSLYAYMSQRLLFASLRNDTKALDEVSKLLGEIKEAWAAIGKGPKTDAKVLPIAPRLTAAK